MNQQKKRLGFYSNEETRKRKMTFYWIGGVPIVYCALTIIGYASLLCVSWSNCHLEGYRFPKISHIGAKQPELQFFAFLCICQAITFGITCHYAYQVWRLMLHKSKLARVTQVCGMISMAGLVLIGCFQVDEASDLHFSGAVMCFILGGMYFILTTVITKQLKEKDKYFEKIYRYRCGITVVIVLLMVIMILTMSVKQYIYNKDPQEETTISIAGCQMNVSYIKMSDHYYSWEVYSSMTEWVSCAIYLMYFYSYRHELKMIGGSSTQILIKDDFELARLVQNSRKYMRANGWAPLGHAGHTNSTDRDDEEEDEHAESGSLLENECFERESGLSRNEMS